MRGPWGPTQRTRKEEVCPRQKKVRAKLPSGAASSSGVPSRRCRRRCGWTEGQDPGQAAPGSSLDLAFVAGIMKSCWRLRTGAGRWIRGPATFQVFGGSRLGQAEEAKTERTLLQCPQACDGWAGVGEDLRVTPKEGKGGNWWSGD